MLGTALNLPLLQNVCTSSNHLEPALYQLRGLHFSLVHERVLELRAKDLNSNLNYYSTSAVTFLIVLFMVMFIPNSFENILYLPRSCFSLVCYLAGLLPSANG